MDESQVIATTLAPRTRSSLTADLRAAGIMPGETVMVHSALSALGWVAGDSATVVAALLDAVAPGGTLVMPAQSGHLSDPAQWRAPPVPADWIDAIRAEMPVYDAETTPTRGMGRIAEHFRTWPGTRRSAHPNCSFTANGPDAEAILAAHRLESPVGEGSPLTRLYECDATILMLGVDFDSCTMLHLAEVRAWPDRPEKTEGAPVLIDGVRHWVTYQAPPTGESDHFIALEPLLREAGLLRVVKVGSAEAKLIGARQLTDFAVAHWRTLPPVM